MPGDGVADGLRDDEPPARTAGRDDAPRRGVARVTRGTGMRLTRIRTTGTRGTSATATRIARDRWNTPRIHVHHHRATAFLPTASHGPREIGGGPEAVLRRKHGGGVTGPGTGGRRPARGLRGEGLASLAPAGGHDGAAGPGTHPGPEAVHTRAATIVGLESPLALGHGTHSFSQTTVEKPPCHAPPRSAPATDDRGGGRWCSRAAVGGPAGLVGARHLPWVATVRRWSGSEDIRPPMRRGPVQWNCRPTRVPDRGPCTLAASGGG